MWICPHCGCEVSLPRHLSKADKFWSLVEIRGPEECWEWKGRKNGRYGYLNMTGAHRIAYELATGEKLGARWCLHSCDNPSCCNPKHLHPGDVAMNNRETKERGRGRRGSQIGTLNSRAKIDEPTARLIKSLLNEGQKPRAISRKIGVAEHIVGAISEGKSWTHID